MKKTYIISLLLITIFTPSFSKAEQINLSTANRDQLMLQLQALIQKMNLMLENQARKDKEVIDYVKEKKAEEKDKKELGVKNAYNPAIKFTHENFYSDECTLEKSGQLRIRMLDTNWRKAVVEIKEGKKVFKSLSLQRKSSDKMNLYLPAGKYVTTVNFNNEVGGVNVNKEKTYSFEINKCTAQKPVEQYKGYKGSEA